MASVNQIIEAHMSRTLGQPVRIDTLGIRKETAAGSTWFHGTLIWGSQRHRCDIRVRDTWFGSWFPRYIWTIDVREHGESRGFMTTAPGPVGRSIVWDEPGGISHVLMPRRQT